MGITGVVEMDGVTEAVRAEAVEAEGETQVPMKDAEVGKEPSESGNQNRERSEVQKGSRSGNTNGKQKLLPILVPTGSGGSRSGDPTALDITNEVRPVFHRGKITRKVHLILERGLQQVIVVEGMAVGMGAPRGASRNDGGTRGTGVTEYGYIREGWWHSRYECHRIRH